MAKIKMVREWGRVDAFEVVDAVPAGFFVWNIGSHAPSGYVPLCEAVPGGGYKVNLGTLKAIKSRHAREILRAASAGGVTLEECRKRASDGDEWTRKRCAAALPYMEEITWN